MKPPFTEKEQAKLAEMNVKMLEHENSCLRIERNMWRGKVRSLQGWAFVNGLAGGIVAGACLCRIAYGLGWLR